MGQVSHSPENISQALELLEEAAKEKSDNIQDLFGKRYAHLQTAIQDLEPELNHMKEKVEVAVGQIKDECVHKAKAANETVHKNPWQFIGGAALGGALIGYFASRSKK